MMSIKTEHLKRCIQTLETSLRFYDQPDLGDVEREVYRNAVIKGFELTQETAFKLLKKALKIYGHKTRALDATPAKDILRLAANHDLFSVEEVERWFGYRDNRNDTAHDYGEEFAQETLQLLPDFMRDVKSLNAKLDTLLKQQD